MKQIKYCGDSSLEKLSEILENEKVKKIFLVTGRKSFELSGAKEKLDKILRDNYDFEMFSEFSPNPKLEDIKKAMKN